MTVSYIEIIQRQSRAAHVKQHMAAIRTLFDRGRRQAFRYVRDKNNFPNHSFPLWFLLRASFFQLNP